MADLSDVENVLVQQISAIVYPGGLHAPSISGGTVRIFRGWPAAIGLNSDLAVGVSTISIFSDHAHCRDTTRYPRIWRSAPPPAVTLEAMVTGQDVVFSGTTTDGLLVGIMADGMPATVPVSASDTVESVVVALAAALPGARANGSELSVPGAATLVARIEAGSSASMETRRQEQVIVATFWCADPRTRDVLTSAVDAALSAIDWLQLPDGSAGHLTCAGTRETDNSENANLYQREIRLAVEYPTIVTVAAPPLTFGSVSTAVTPAVTVAGGNAPAFPRLGAIRFDAWYDPSDTIDQQCADALSDPQWLSRLPPNAVVANGSVSWPLATQATIDAEIMAASLAGLDFWAFDSYQPGDGLGMALTLYLSSSVRDRLSFCMLGQSSNWADPSSSSGYSGAMTRDISMMLETGYLKTYDGRPVYFVLDASGEELALLPGSGITDAILRIRSSVTAQGGQNPYIVWLSGAPMSEYDNVPAAIAAGADAAGAYATPALNGTEQGYAALAVAAEQDWQDRCRRGFEMVPTAMAGWDQRPLVERPQPFYPIDPAVTSSSFYDGGTPTAIATQVGDLAAFVLGHPAACAAGVGLVYAWNELAEGGWLMPTYAEGSSDETRVIALEAELGHARRCFFASTRTYL